MAIVIGGEVNQPLFTTEETQTSRRWLIIVLAILVLLLLIGVLVYAHHKSELSMVCSNTAESSNLQTAAAAIDSNNYQKLQPIVEKIQGLSGYKNDPNCLYVIVNNYIMSSNIQKSSYYLGLLNKVYNPKEGFSNHFETRGTKHPDIARGCGQYERQQISY